MKFISWAVLKRFLPIFILLVVLIGIITSIIYYNDLTRDRKFIESSEALQVDKLKEIITVQLDLVFSDLLILSDHNNLLELVDTHSATDRYALAKVFLSYSMRKQVFDQIRFLDETGKEIVRVNFNNGDPFVVPDDKLQEKRERYYYEDIFNLNRGGIYVSPFDLNIEYGQIEQPLKPIIRFGTPIFSSGGQISGVLILNYLGTDLLEHLAWLDSNISGGQIMLLNSDGFWLKGPNEEDEWGFMYENKTNLTFGNAFPDAWQQVSNNESGQLITEDGLFTYNTIYPLSEGMKTSAGSGRPFEPSKAMLGTEDYYWKILSRVTPGVLMANPRRLIKKVLQVDGVLLPISTIILWFLVHTRLLRKQANEELKKYKEHLEELVEERTAKLQDALQKTKQANKVKDLFLANISHEIRTPLNSFLGFTDIIKEKVSHLVNPEERTFFDIIRNSGERLTRTVHEVLDISQIEAGTYELKTQPLNLAELTGEVVRELESKAKGKGLEIGFTPEIPDTIIEADEYSIKQALVKIIENAIKYTNEGRVDISLKKADGKYNLTIQDSGIGMSPDYQKQLFEPFTQESTGYTKEYQGIGLGLALAKRHLDMNKIEIDVKSTKGVGTIIKLTCDAVQKGTGGLKST